MKVTALTEGISDHSAWHDDPLLRTLLAQSCMDATRASFGTKTRACSAEDILLLEIEAPTEQSIRVSEIDPKAANEWHGGLNRCPPAMADKLGELLHAETAKYGVAVASPQDCDT